MEGILTFVSPVPESSSSGSSESTGTSSASSSTDYPIEITIDESYVVADEIPVFVNYPVIQTGVDFEITPPMIAGAALIGAGGIGSMVMLLKRKKKHGKA